jgi:hypothetical protein
MIPGDGIARVQDQPRTDDVDMIATTKALRRGRRVQIVMKQS